MRKFFTLFFSMTAVFTLLSLMSIGVFAAERQILQDGFAYTVNGDSATIVKYKGSETELTVPAKLGDTPVTAIKYDAFVSSSITKLTLPASIRDIGESNVSSFAVNRFCDTLAFIEVDPQNTMYKSIDGVLFSNDALTLITYPCAKTDELYRVPDSVIYIMRYAFAKNKSLVSIDMGANVQLIGNNAFSTCTSLRTAYLSHTISSIPDSGFEGCTALVEIQIPESLTDIHADAFKNCSSLISLTLPSGVTSVAGGAFAGCASLSFIAVNGTYGIGDDAALASAFSGFTGINKETFKIYLSDGSLCGINSSGTAVYLKNADGNANDANTTSAPTEAEKATEPTGETSIETLPETLAHTTPKLTEDPKPAPPVGDPAAGLPKHTDVVILPAITTVGQTTVQQTTAQQTTVTEKVTETSETKKDTTAESYEEIVTVETGYVSESETDTPAKPYDANDDSNAGDMNLVYFLGTIAAAGLISAVVYLIYKKGTIRKF